MRKLLGSAHLPLYATLLVLALLYATASMLYEGFFSVRVFVNLFGDNAALGIAALGMTFVILSGGIDLSVGSVLAFTTTFTAAMIQNVHMHPAVAIVLALLIGICFGALM
ncbi:MAG TPA: sugar ABC transporter permease YjfF, partial [Verrucomicrobiae bacterium]